MGLVRRTISKHAAPLRYVVDFCCLGRSLVVEVDGGQHSEDRDAPRTAWLVGEGYRVLRFWNNDVLTNMDGVLQTILIALREEEDPHPNPLPHQGEGA